MGYRIKPTLYIKYKALKLVTPEFAESQGIPAEAPCFISPYITHVNHCIECRVTYSPLMYQIGRTTEAQHFCKTHGGGIYVRLADDTSGKWVYTRDLWDVIVHPEGPIRMGNDRGYQFRSVTPTQFMAPICHVCHSSSSGGILALQSLDNNTLLPYCYKCPPYPPNISVWSYSWDGTSIHFHQPTVQTLTQVQTESPQATSYEAFLQRTNASLHPSRTTPQEDNTP